ncbi:hypothetical protein GR11A_00032 [Vibrio phage vB_VcorM_GR11A]|nr:hypothetical protein GR11A_00032 [Vibrio phage vB_VcorM_GR11A]
MSSEVYRVLSFDPGKYNFAYSYTEHKVSGGRVKTRVLETGLMQVPLDKLDDAEFSRQCYDFKVEFTGMLRRFSREFGEINLITLERYMGRGTMVGTTIEVCGIMIGLITSAVHDRGLAASIQLVTSAIWKNAFNRINTDAQEELGKKKTTQYLHLSYNLCRTSAHELDAVLIGLYGAYKYFGKKPYETQASEKERDRLLSKVEQATTLKLEKRRQVREHFYFEEE